MTYVNPSMSPPPSTSNTESASSSDAAVQALREKMVLALRVKDIENELKELSQQGDKVAEFQRELTYALGALESGLTDANTLEWIERLVNNVQAKLELKRTVGFDLLVRANAIDKALKELTPWSKELPIWGRSVREAPKTLEKMPLSVRALQHLEEMVEFAKKELQSVRAQ